MPKLIAKSALNGRAPLTLAGTTLAEVDLGPITSIAPYRGALRVGNLDFPAPNTFASAGDARLVWSGHDQAFLIGAPCPELDAAITDQTDGWATLRLSGPAAVDTLARYVPLDLRLAAFPVGAAARSQLYHMPTLLMRIADEAFDILVFRSMARTAWHELEIALKTLDARAK